MQITYPGGALASTYRTIANADLPSWATSGTESFVIAGWIRRGTGAGTAFRTVCVLGNMFHIQTGSGAAAQVRMVIHDDDNSVNCNCVLQPANGDWIFFAASFNYATGAIVMVARSENTAKGGVSNRTTGTATFTNTGSATRTVGDFSVAKNKVAGEGGGAGTANAWNGEVGWLVLRNQDATQAQLEGMVDAAFTELSGQTGRYNPLIGLTYVGSGFNGPLGVRWLVAHGPLSQSPANGSGGARIGVAATSDNASWWNYTSASSSSADVVAIVDTNPTITLTGTVNYSADDPDFFGLPAPGQTTNGNNGVPSNIVVRIRDAAVPAGSGIQRGLVGANSRAVRHTAYAGGTDPWGKWAGNFCNGLIGAKPSIIAGVCNVAASTIGVRRPFFDFDATPSQSGTITAVTSSTYNDFSRGWTNSLVSGSTGPGSGWRYGANAELSQRYTPLAGTLLDGTTQARHTRIIAKYPGSPDTFDWELEDAAAVSGSGTTIDSGSVSGLDTTLFAYLYDTGTDSYSAGTPSLTLAIAPGDQALITAALAAGQIVVVYVSSGTGAGGLAQVTNLVPGATALISLKHALGNSLANTDTLRFGIFDVHVLEVVAPIPTLACQGLRIIAPATAGLVEYAIGVEAVGVDGIVPGTLGKGGQGYSAQISKAFTGLYGLMATAWDLDWAWLFVAGQDSATHADRENLAALLGLPANSVVMGSDPTHRITDNETAGWAEDSLAQSVYPAVVSTESCGSFLGAYSRSYKQNGAHPSMEQYVLIWETASVVAAGMPREPDSAGPVLAAGARFRVVDRFRTR